MREPAAGVQNERSLTSGPSLLHTNRGGEAIEWDGWSEMSDGVIVSHSINKRLMEHLRCEQATHFHFRISKIFPCVRLVDAGENILFRAM